MIMRTVDADGKATPILASQQSLRRQDEPVVYELNGAIYVNSWIDLTPALTFGYNPSSSVMDEISSIDIDLMEDFVLAEKYLRARRAQTAARCTY